jgi:hypothetical protein
MQLGLFGLGRISTIFCSYIHYHVDRSWPLMVSSGASFRYVFVRVSICVGKAQCGVHVNSQKSNL